MPRAGATVAAVVILLAAGCAQSVSGRGVASEQLPSTATRTLSVPSAGSQQSTTDPTPPGTTTVAASGSAATPESTIRSTLTSADTITEYTTVFDTEEPPPPPATTAPAASATGPASVIGPISMGPNDSGYLVFQSPSGNIMCGIYTDAGSGGARCDIQEWMFVAPTPLECGEVNYNVGTAEVGADGSGTLGACVGDTVADPASPVLAYGANAGAGDFACHSAQDGVTCANLITGHGFRLARASYQLF